jgi:colanic acid/amylovoran biosynthesis glycosyltransferase
MRVGYLVSCYPAPSHTFIRREVEALRRRGLDVETFSVRAPDASARLGAADREERGRTFYVLPVSPLALVGAHLWALFRAPARYFGTVREAFRHRVPGLRSLVWSAFYFLEAMVLARALVRRGIERLHNHFANAGANVGMLSARYLALPWSLTLHGISEFDYPAGVMLPGKVGAARFVACVSWFGMAQAMRVSSPTDWDKLLIVRCGIEAGALPPRRTVPGPPRIVCVGRLSAEKGHLGLLDAFARVLARGAAAELRLVGDGPERARIEQRLAERGLAGHCLLLGQLPEEDALAEVAAAAVVVSASFMEGLPVVLMEALALGVPVVAPRVAGVPELVVDGMSGVLFTPADWEGLGAGLERLLADAGLRERMGRAGKERVDREFEADRACEPLHRRFVEDQEKA